MARAFEVPPFYRSASISAVKQLRKISDPRKKDLTPSVIDFGPICFKLARHFGFCFGVENAIEIAYRAVEENQGRRIFLLSEMIHNPEVNADLAKRGVRFLMNTSGEPLIPFESLTPEDIVIVPAFGTTLELQAALKSVGIDPYFYDTTCPFVEKVWKRSEDLGRRGFTVIIHGKGTHEETRATFSHSKDTAPTLVIFDLADAEAVVDTIHERMSADAFMLRFGASVSAGFDPATHLQKVGVVNQTTMLASETQRIAETIRVGLVTRYGDAAIGDHFADTRDTLCYATNENQSATRALIDSGLDLAIVVGGYNSSNTSHLVELAEEHVPTFYIRNASSIVSDNEIRHFMLAAKEVRVSENWLPRNKVPLTVGITSGASCPDAIVDGVIARIVGFFPGAKNWEEAFRPFTEQAS
jgi:4-hydroxy-3-methylbut-2-en-1-yl diphosphate reductase